VISHWRRGNALKIYTKTGDAGETGLFGGGRVSKDDPRVCAYGDVDELNATLGFAAALEPAGFESDVVQAIQRDLFAIGAELATRDAAKVREHVGAGHVSALEQVIDRHEATLTPLKNFILPGGTPKAAALHVARTTCRRAERAVVQLAREEQINPIIIHYLNRLSDLLFVLARAVNTHAGRADIAW
jgi:cob(I)alamin adenosyltransferase